MSRNNTGNPIGSKAFLDFEDNVKNLDDAVNAEQDTFQDRLGKSRLTWAGMENQFDADQAERVAEFNADQTSREQEFRTFIASSGYQFGGDYAPGIEITEYNQLIRDENGEFWRVSGQVDLPYVTTGAGIPEGDALVPAGDAVLRQELSRPEGAAMVAGGSIIYRPSVQQLLAMDTSQLVEGQAAKVRGTEFSWNGTAWEPVGRIYVNSWGARGDAPQRAWQTGFTATNSRQAFIDAALYAESFGHKYVFAEPGIYYAPDLLASEMADLYIVGDGVSFTYGTSNQNTGHAQVLALREQEYLHGWPAQNNRVAGHGTIAFEFDDSTISQWAMLPDLFKDYGASFGIAYIMSYECPWIREIHRHGFEILAHDIDNTGATTLTDTQLHARAVEQLDIIEGITGQRDNIGYVYPMHNRDARTDDVYSQYFQTGRGNSYESISPDNFYSDWLCSSIALGPALETGDLTTMKRIIANVALNNGRAVFYVHVVTPLMVERFRELLDFASGLGVNIVSPRAARRPPGELVKSHFRDQTEFSLSANASWDETDTAPNDPASIRVQVEGTGTHAFHFQISSLRHRNVPGSGFAQYRVSFLYKSESEVSSINNFGIGVRFSYLRLNRDGNTVSGNTRTALLAQSLPAADFDNRVSFDVFAPKEIASLALGIGGAGVQAPFDIRFGDVRITKIADVPSVSRVCEVGSWIDFVVLGGEPGFSPVSALPTVSAFTYALVGVPRMHGQNYGWRPTTGQAEDNGKSVVVSFSPTSRW